MKDFSGISDRPDKGILLESYVLLKLQTILTPGMEIKFWRTKDGDEVDFILLINRKPIPIEVKSRLSKAEIPKGIKRFLLRYKDIKSAYVINETIMDTLEYNSCKIHFISFATFEEGGIQI